MLTLTMTAAQPLRLEHNSTNLRSTYGLYVVVMLGMGWPAN